MRLPHFALPSSPIPHRPAPTPLARSPTSLLGLTASQLRRRANTTRASSSEPTVAYGLANWRRQPKKQSGSGTGTTSTGSKGTSGRVKKGAGMGMESTPAKKGKRSHSRSMGAHSTPATKIPSRHKSHSTTHSEVLPVAQLEGSLSSLNSSFPSSAEFLTPSPISRIPDLSSPSIPAILPSRRRLDVFDSDYAAQRRGQSSSEVEEWEALVQLAEEQDVPEELIVEEEGDELYAWKQDTMWSVQGSTASTVKSRRKGTIEEDEEESGTVQERTIYNDLLMTMNDETGPSLSSRTQARSSTIKNRQHTPRKPRQSLPAARPITAKEKSRQWESGAGNDTLMPFSRNDLDALLQESTDDHICPSLQISLNDRTQYDDPSSRTQHRASKIKDRKSTPHKSSSQYDAAPNTEEDDISHIANPVRQSSGVGRSLSNLLESSHPISHGNLSQLLQSTQSSGVPADPNPDLPEDVSMEAGRTVLRDSISPVSPMSPMAQVPHYDGDVLDAASPADSGPHPFHDEFAPHSPSPADMERTKTASDNVVLSPSRFRWHPYDRNTLPVPYTPSSHLSPASLRPPLSPVSFISTPPASLHLAISPPPLSRRLKHPPRSTRKGAWRGAEVLARMEAADRGSARYHMAFERLSPASEIGTDMGDGTAGRKGRRPTTSAYEESEDVLAARRRRLDHYQELEIGYKLHIELVL